MLDNVKVENVKIKFLPFMDSKRIKQLDIYYYYKEKKIRICELVGEEMQKKHEIEL